MVHLCRLIEYSHVNILPQIAQITQRGMQQAALFRRERQIGVSLAWGIVVLLFICDYLRDLREILWFLVCRLIEYACMLFSRRWRRSRRGMQQELHYIADKDWLVWLMLFCCFGVCLRKSAGSAEDIVGSYMLIG